MDKNIYKEIKSLNEKFKELSETCKERDIRKDTNDMLSRMEYQLITFDDLDFSYPDLKKIEDTSIESECRKLAKNLLNPDDQITRPIPTVRLQNLAAMIGKTALDFVDKEQFDSAHRQHKINETLYCISKIHSKLNENYLDYDTRHKNAAIARINYWKLSSCEINDISKESLEGDIKSKVDENIKNILTSAKGSNYSYQADIIIKVDSVLKHIGLTFETYEGSEKFRKLFMGQNWHIVKKIIDNCEHLMTSSPALTSNSTCVIDNHLHYFLSKIKELKELNYKIDWTHEGLTPEFMNKCAEHIEFMKARYSYLHISAYKNAEIQQAIEFMELTRYINNDLKGYFLKREKLSWSRINKQGKKIFENLSSIIKNTEKLSEYYATVFGGLAVSLINSFEKLGEKEQEKFLLTRLYQISILFEILKACLNHGVTVKTIQKNANKYEQKSCKFAASFNEKTFAELTKMAERIELPPKPFESNRVTHFIKKTLNAEL